MARFTPADDLQAAEFVDVDLTRARFVGADLSGAVLRGVQVGGVEIDAPWLFEDDGALVVNGVDVRPFVDAELDRRFPGRAERHAPDPETLRSAWAAVEHAWGVTIVRANDMPAGSVDVSVDGEWSFAQTLRHLVLATDVWLGKAVLLKEQPFHPLGLRDASMAPDEAGTSPFTDAGPTWDEVLEARSGRVRMVRDFVAGSTPELLASARTNPHDPSVPETVLSCLHTILGEEWEHLRYAVRDLDALEARRPAGEQP